MSHITVSVGRVPGPSVEVNLNGGRTVKDALQAAGMTLDDRSEIQVNGSPGTPETAVTNGAIILLVKRVTGNF